MISNLYRSLFFTICSLVTSAAVLAERVVSTDHQVESPGPSSRLTGLAITEIMYHPSDGREDLEFIEVFNSQSVSQDVSSYRMAGDIDYVFPSDAVIPKRGVFLVAKNPDALKAEYGLENIRVFGPYTNQLGNGGGNLRLLNKTGGLLLEVSYSDRSPWPVAADGFGSSVVLARPSFGQNDPRAWSASSKTKGTPGNPVVDQSNPLLAIKINEVFPNDPDSGGGFVELFNHGNVALPLDGILLQDGSKANPLAFPQGSVIQPGERLSLETSFLKFDLDRKGGVLVLQSVDGDLLMDAVDYSAVSKGESWGRLPDGGRSWSRLKSPTPAEPNREPVIGPVVINEIMFAPISGDDNEEFLELHNVSDQPVDLSNWQFRDGIDFEFPEGTWIAEKGYLVLTRNRELFINKYPALKESDVVGDYSGSLANGGERLLLASPVQVEGATAWLPQSIVSYQDGGDWGHWADRGGSSLELRNPLRDGRIGLNWGDSDESQKTPWVGIEHEGRLEGGINQADELDIMLLGEGEVLLDKMEVSFGDGVNRVNNSDLESNANLYIIQGNHVRSGHNPNEGYESNGSLHVRASSGGDNGANRIEYQIVSPRQSSPGFGEPVKISARAKWLTGHTNLLFRIQGNWFEGVTSLSPSPNPGTPGRKNSIHHVSPPPVIHHVSHQPVAPVPGEAIRILAELDHGQGGMSMSVKALYRLDPDEALHEAPMNDEGLAGDLVPGDGVFTGLIPGQSEQTLVAYHILAEIATPDGVLQGRFPIGGPEKEGLVPIGKLNRAPFFGTYHLLLTERNRSTWRQREPLSNEPVDATLIYNNEIIIYNIGARYRGSPFIRRGYTDPITSIAAMVWQMPKDRPFLGSTEVNLDSLEQSGGRDDTLQRENTSFWIAEQMGIPFSQQRYVQLFTNGRINGQVFADVQQPNPDYIEAWFPDDADGEIYKIDDWFEFDDGFGFININATLQNFNRSDGEKNQARYRWSWEKKSNKGLDDDYSSLFGLVDAMNSFGMNYTATVESLVDVEQWLRVFGVRHIVGDWDGYGYRRGKNQFAYKPRGGKWKMLLWDLDFSLGGGSDSSQHNLYDTSDPVISQFYRNPAFNRIYMRIMQEAVDGPLQQARIDARMNETFDAFRENGTRGAAHPRPISTWIGARRNYIQQQIRPYQASFSILSNNGRNFSSDSNLLTLNGSAPLEVDQIVVNGIPHPPVWITETQWQIQLALEGTVNRLSVQGMNTSGELLATATDQITITFNGEPEVAEDHLAISEIMYAPMDPEAEFLEIANTSLTHAFNLAGYRVEGINYEFPPGSIIRPRQFLVLISNPTAFTQAYGTDVEVFSTYNGRLNNAGETVRLIKPATSQSPETIVQSVAYSPGPPWPANADGKGASLQRIDTAQAPDRPGNWAATNPNPEWKHFSATGVINDNRILIHHSPFIPRRPSGRLDGHWDAFITFQGQRIPYQVVFTRNASDSLEATFYVENDGFEVPLVLTVNGNNITYKFSNEPNSPTWQGIIDFEANRITGTYFEPGLGETIPFEMTPREVIPSERVVLIDEVYLNEGSVARSGPNLLQNGGFENPLVGNWTLTESHGDSIVTTESAYSGNHALKLVSRYGGEGLDTSIWQAAPIIPGNTYTLSYWYRTSKTARQLTVKTADGSIDNGSHSVAQQAPFSPGEPNSMQRPLPPFKSVWLNEIGVSQDQSALWLEIYNAEDTDLDVSAYRLVIGENQQHSWSFPPGSNLPKNSFALVGIPLVEGAGSEAGTWIAPLPLETQAGTVYLVHSVDGEPIPVDYMAYRIPDPTHSFGRIPDGGSGALGEILNPTPGSANTSLMGTYDIRINEWMPANVASVKNPADGAYDDWLELYNAGTTEVNLKGFSLSDDPNEPRKAIRTQDLPLAPGAYLVVWADDGKPAANTEWHLPFRLSRDGESILLYGPDGALADRVDFGPMQNDESQGRIPDGQPGISQDLHPTPGSANAVKDMEVPTPQINTTGLRITEQGLRIQWQTRPGIRYEIQFNEDLANGDWHTIDTVTTQTDQATYQVNLENGVAAGFIRIRVVP